MKRSKATRGAPRLVAIGQTGPRQFRLLDRVATVGRQNGNNLLLDDPNVSSSHAEIRKSFLSGRFLIKDLNSLNGTFLNQEPIKGSVSLSTGDEIRFGSGLARFTFIDLPGRKWIRTIRRVLLGFAALTLFGFALALLGLNHSLGGVLKATREKHSEEMKRASDETTRLVKQISMMQTELAREKSLAGQPDWLKRVNDFRSLSKLSLAMEDQKLSDGDFNHARYLTKFWLRNNASPPGSEAHSEDKDDPWYSAEGYSAARTPGNVIPFSPGNLTGYGAIDMWVSGPFHRPALLDPGYGFFGYGQFCESAVCAAALSIRSSFPSAIDAPVMFPGDGAEVRLTTYTGGEWPDPLSSCPGYKAPTGLPITLRLDSRTIPKLSDYSVTRSGGVVETCGFDSFSYKSSDAFVQRYARNILAGYRMVVLIPKTPFVSGAEYSVSSVVEGRTYSWHFSVK